jgi:hypothetical protein
VILLLSLPVGVAVGLAAGGRLERLRALRLRGELFLVALLIVQGVLPLLAASGVGKTTLYWSWAATFPLMVLICLINLRVPGAVLAGAGLALNGAVILLNSGMPVLPEAILAAGGSIAALGTIDFAHTVAGARTVLVVLADVMPMTGPVIVRGVASAGDVLLASGVAILIAASELSVGHSPGTAQQEITSA